VGLRSLIFFVSGAAGLVFEIVWFYRCGLVLGSTVWAATFVLSSFTGGLAIGNAIVARYATRIRSPLTAYAIAEFTVASVGVALAVLLAAGTTRLTWVPRFIVDKVWLVNALRLATTFAALLVPATAMGATLPLVVSDVTLRGGGFGSALGRLYGWNTLGAVCGSVCAEVVLIQQLGVTGTALIAGLLDTGVGVTALWLARRDPLPSAHGGKRRTPAIGDQPPAVTVGHRRAGRVALILTAAFVSGAILLALEVVWFRFLSMYVLMTTLAMSVMLAVVLTAIGLGGLLASRWLGRTSRPIRQLPSVALAAGFAVVVSYGSFQTLTEGNQIGDWYRVLWCAGVLTFATSLLSGVIFTLMGETLSRDVNVEGRAAAWLTIANTTGGMSGPLVALFILLPALGTERSLCALAAAYAIPAVLTMVALDRGAERAPGVLLVAAGGVFVTTLVLFPFGSLHATYFPRVAAAYAADGSEVVATREGPNETILLMQQTWLGKPVYHRLVTNGFSMSGTAVPALRYMRDFVYLPMLVRGSPLRRVLVVCYGVGVTAAAATDVDSVESIDVVEISRDVVKMSDRIYTPDRHPLYDRRVRVHIEDGRFFLATTDERFDLITGEPPPPRTPGAVNIYTTEYFTLIYDRLAEGGMTTYWLPVGRPNPGTDVNTIVRAFCDVFEDCSLWNATPFDLILLGSRHAQGAANEAGFTTAWNAPRLRSRLREIGFDQPEQIGATFLGDSSFLHDLTADTRSLTDDFPQRLRPQWGRPSLSDPRYSADPAVMQLYQRVIDPGRARQAFATSPLIRRLFPAPLTGKTLSFFDQQQAINRVLWEGGQPLRLIDDLDAVLTKTSLRTLPLWILGSDDVKQRIATASSDQTGVVEYVAALQSLVERHYDESASRIRQAERRGFRGVTVRPLLAYALYRGGHADAAHQLAREAQPNSEDEIHFWRWLRAQLH
jgi:spermidine synthase